MATININTESPRWFYTWTRWWFQEHNVDFRQFIKYAKAYDGGDSLLRTLKTNPHFIIYTSFTWSHTPEGHYYWSKLDTDFTYDTIAILKQKPRSPFK